MPERIFLLSPASCAGRRCHLLMRPDAEFDLARRVHGQGAPLGEVFSFLSALYFRGKLAYAETFAKPPTGCPGVLVITPGRGLLPPSVPIDASDVRAFSSVSIDLSNSRYLTPLTLTALELRERLTPCTEVVLLGSVATSKYIGALLEIFGPALRFPGDFVGRGDMSRGGLMLRSAEAERELEYLPVSGAITRGKRPPKLPRLARRVRVKPSPSADE